MNDDQFNALKQFVASTVSRAEDRLQVQIARLQSEVSEVRSEVAEVRSEMASGFEGVSEAIEQIHQHAETQEAAVNQRFTKLEQQAA